MPIITETKQLYPSLSLREGQVYHLHQKEKYKHKEIADELGVSVRTSEGLLYRARLKIKDIIKTTESMKS